jgi:acyl carrier protein
MDKINEIIIETLKVSEDQTELNLGMDDVANWDSLSHMNLIVSIEDEFGIEISGDDIAEMISFESIKNTVAKYI